MIRPRELATDDTYGSTGRRGSDIWATFQAAAGGDCAELTRLLSHDPALATVEYEYRTAIHFAVREGHQEAVELLLAAGAPAAADDGGEDLVTLATDRGHRAIAARLHEEIERRREGRAELADHAIHIAAEGGDLQGLKALLAAHPDLIERRDRAGGTALHRAVAAAQHAAIEVLLAHGADIHARHAAGPGSSAGYAPAGFQAVDLALWDGPYWGLRSDFDTARLLVAQGADNDLVIATALGDLDVVTRLLEADASQLAAARPHGKRALSTAVQFGRDSILRLLLARGADPNEPEGPLAPRGSALHAAARAGHREHVELLLEHGADPDAVVDSSGSATYAARTPELRTVLQQHGGALNAYDLIWLDEDDAALALVTADPQAAEAGCGGVFAAACTLGKRDLVIALLQAGIRVPAMVNSCRSYLWARPEMLALLLESGMDPDLPNWQHATPLHDVCSRDGRGRPRPHRTEVAEMLIEAGATLDARDETYRSTPLAWAARQRLPDMVALLLHAGAAVRLPDDESWATPFAWAERRGHADILALLSAATG